MNYSRILTGRHRGCFNTLKKLTILGFLSLLWLDISLLQILLSRCVPVSRTAPGSNYLELQDDLNYINNAHLGSRPFSLNLLARQLQLVHMTKCFFYQVHSSFTVLAVVPTQLGHTIIIIVRLH